MTETQDKQAQLRAEAKAKVEARRATETVKFDGILAALKAEVADLNPTDIAAGFRVGGVDVEKGYSPYAYYGGPRVPDRITVCYSERKGAWRTTRKTLTYTKLDVIRIAGRVREAVGVVANGKATRDRIEREEEAARQALETRLAPAQAEVATFNGITGAARFHAAVEDRAGAFRLTVDLASKDELVVVLQALLQGVIKDGGAQ